MLIQTRCLLILASSVVAVALPITSEGFRDVSKFTAKTPTSTGSLSQALAPPNSCSFDGRLGVCVATCPAASPQKPSLCPNPNDVCCIEASPPSSVPTTPPPKASRLWRVDLSQWSDYFLAPPMPGRNHGRQYYNANPAETSYFDDGKLVLPILAKSSKPGYAYSTAFLQSRQTFGAGRLDVRAKMPKGLGAWPAVWFLPQDQLDGKKACRYKAASGKCYWPTVGEMDIFETVSGHMADPDVHQTLHLGRAGTGMSMKRSSVGSKWVPPNPAWWDQPHTFSFIRSDSVLQWIIDGQVTYSMTADSVYGFTTDPSINNRPSSWGDQKMAPFDASNEFNLIINIAVGGTWPCSQVGCAGGTDQLLPNSSLNDGSKAMVIESITYQSF